MKIGKYSYFSLKEFQDYYKENYPGKNRTEVSKLNQIFYQTIYKKDLLDEVFPKVNGKFTDYYLKELKRNMEIKK